MTSQCIVVANASLARLFRRDAPGDPLVPLPTLSHAESRAKGEQLASDRPGHEATDHSPGGNRFEPRTDPRRKEHQRFAHEVAKRLDDVLTQLNFHSLAIFASDPFLGELKGALSDAVRQRLHATQPSDYTSLGLDELEQRLRDTPTTP
jgi:protein required for attachment to host cells